MGLASPLSAPTEPIRFDGDCDAMDHLEVSIEDDGTVILDQTRVRGMGGSDEQIQLHPMQAAWLVAKLQSILGQAQSSEEDKLKRRLLRLREHIAEFACADTWDDVVKRCSLGPDLRKDLNFIVELTSEFLEESGIDPEGCAGVNKSAVRQKYAKKEGA